MNILGIDPGTTQSGVVVFDGARVIEASVMGNAELLAELDSIEADLMAVEWIESMGMPVGKEVFLTCLYVGRLVERWPGDSRLVTRRDVKLHLCGSMRAKDGNVRQAIIDKVGPPGTKKNPGPTYGIRSHAWSALAVAVTAAETE